jgi:hypothetical protein
MTKEQRRMAEKQTATRRGRPVLALRFVGRRSFGVTTKPPRAVLRDSPEGVKHMDVLNKPHSSRLAQGQNRLGRSDSAIVNRP